MNFIRIVFTVIVALIQASCTFHVRAEEAPIRNNGYYFKMSDEEKTKFIQNFNKIKINDEWKKIEALLGPPDHEKKLYTKGPKPKFLSKVRVYYVAQYRKDIVNLIHDRRVRLSFDESERLTKISSNIELKSE